MDALLQEAYERAVDVLQRCVTRHGFRASALEQGYPQVWARDSAITSLGALLTGDPDLTQAARASLLTLARHQYPRGLIPLNVHPETSYVSTENAGGVDSNLWFILAHYHYYLTVGDLDFLRAQWQSIDLAFHWLGYQDMNECGLLEIPEAGDWMDLFAVRYNVLYDNVLYYAASLAHGRMARTLGLDGASSFEQAAGIHERINLVMWIDRCWVAQHFAEHLEQLKAMRLEWFMLYHNVGTISSRPFYLPWVAFREYGDYCDALGNLLAILTGIADEHRAEHILRHMYQVGMAYPFPTKAIHPPVYPGEPNWREYYRSRNLNLPHQYHNGGIWPFIGGFHVAALRRFGWNHEARSLLLDLARACQRGVVQEWEFNEWLHGETGNPMGYAWQAWSASMYIYAHHAVCNEEMTLFDELLTLKPAAAVADEGRDLVSIGAGSNYN